VALINAGFQGRRRQPGAGLVPPGQQLVDHFPVLTAGPTPRVDLATWDLTVLGLDGEVLRRWTWDELRALPVEQPTVDIHCVTHWSKLGTRWEGVSVDVLLDGVDPSPHVLVLADPDYTTNLGLEDLTGGRAWVVWGYDGGPLPVEHGGPARLLVPHLYLWKSAKWVRGFQFTREDVPGFWEGVGYHSHGDPWREQRYRGDR
jgi:DMSO/TMAO reductase YedYZ molybdopterin-dependent catalytic subunit